MAKEVPQVKCETGLKIPVSLEWTVAGGRLSNWMHVLALAKLKGGQYLLTVISKSPTSPHSAGVGFGGGGAGEVVVAVADILEASAEGVTVKVSQTCSKQTCFTNLTG